LKLHDLKAPVLQAVFLRNTDQVLEEL